MNETMNFNQIGGNTSNYRLRKEPVKLMSRRLVGCRPDGDGYEEVWDEEFDYERHRTKVKPGLPRKQQAARRAIPLSTVTIVKKLEVQPRSVVMAVLNERTPEEQKIYELETEIRNLMGLVRKGKQ